MTTTELDLSPLQDDGDTLDLGDGRMLRLRIEVDQSASINDYDCYGRVSTERERETLWGYKSRPSDVTGNAEKLWYGNLGFLGWWEPPADVKRTDPHFRELREEVKELLAYGFSGVILELCEGRDYYGKPVVINSASLWGIDSLDNGYIHEVVRELADEMGVN